MFITKMGTSIPQDLIDYGNSRKATCGGDHHISPAIAGWVRLPPKEIAHGPASCTGVATSGSQHRGSRALFGPGRRHHACVGLRASLKASAGRGLGCIAPGLPSELSQGGRGFNAESDETMPCVQPPWTQQVDLRPFNES